MSELRVEHNAFQVAEALAGAAARAGARAFKVTAHWGLILQNRVKAHAQGRPGPRMVTGDYNRSIALAVGTERGSPSATVGTNKAQGRRLELGFVGEDDAGRHYDQPPYPHFGPALDEVSDPFEQAVAEIAEDL